MGIGERPCLVAIREMNDDMGTPAGSGTGDDVGSAIAIEVAGGYLNAPGKGLRIGEEA